MIKYFELLLDLLDIQSKSDFLEIAKVIQDHQGKKINVYHQYFFVFEGYQKLLKGEMKEDEFLQLGDFMSKMHYDNRDDSISFLRGNPSLNDDEIYIFDSLAKGIISDKNNVYYC